MNLYPVSFFHLQVKMCPSSAFYLPRMFVLNPSSFTYYISTEFDMTFLRVNLALIILLQLEQQKMQIEMGKGFAETLFLSLFREVHSVFSKKKLPYNFMPLSTNLGSQLFKTPEVKLFKFHNKSYYITQYHFHFLLIFFETRIYTPHPRSDHNKGCF